MVPRFDALAGHLLGFARLRMALGWSAQAESEGNPWWLWIIIFVVLAAFVGFMLWWWLHDEDEEEATMPARHAQAPPPIPSPPPAQPDDLKRIEGIGPRISGVLQEAGIRTFEQLADTDAGRIREILEAADPNLLRLADPATWPEQAALAAEGDWQALEALQDELKGGRRA
jgi:predicted flap endonuclease-1-like 5' DNA nuclease